MKNLVLITSLFLATVPAHAVDPIVLHDQNCASVNPLAPIDNLLPGGTIACAGADASMSGKTKSLSNLQMQVNAPGREAQNNLAQYVGVSSNQLGGVNVGQEIWNVTEGMGTQAWAQKTVNWCGGEGNNCLGHEDYLILEQPVNPANPSAVDGNVVHAVPKDPAKPAVARSAYHVVREAGATYGAGLLIDRTATDTAVAANGAAYQLDVGDKMFTDATGFHVVLRDHDGTSREVMTLLRH